MQIKTFLAHGDMEKLESDINAFLATSGGPPVFTELAIDERRVFVMMGFNDPPPTPSVEPVGTSDPTAAPPPTTPPPANAPVSSAKLAPAPAPAPRHR